MFMKPMPNMDIKTVGSSHYLGDIYTDLESRWIQKVTLNEIVVSETELPVPPGKLNAVSERTLLIRNVTEKEMLQE